MVTPDLPLGTVSFLFTDIEGSTRLLQDMGDRFRSVLERHNELVSAAAAVHGGVVVKNEGDGFFMAFRSALDAVACAVDVQRTLAAEPWPPPRPIRVRIGVHTGEGRLGGSDYVGLDVHRAARIGACGHGGQVLLSEATTRLTEYAMPTGTRIEDLGSHRLKDLENEEHLYQLSIEGLPAAYPPLRTLSSMKGNLPNRDLAFIGREREREQVTAALKMSRLITLTGPGGVGKTSLALNVAEELSPTYPDGVWLVEVSRVADEELLPAAIARQLHITEGIGEPLVDTLTSRLARARTLLILDGCEHLIEAVAKLADQLLQWTAELQILATSREWLSIRGEHLVQVGPLDIPGPGLLGRNEVASFDAVALFVNRAMLVQPAFELDEANSPLVAEICRRLDGIPLAIELAAARLKVLSVWQLVERLDQQFALLASRTRDIPPHQQTLETTLDWSYDFLTRVEQTLFTRLSVFAGGFTLEAVEQVCSGGLVARDLVFDLLGRLVETSLVMASDTDPVRYRLLEPIAHYARMRLAEREDPDDLRERHARYHLDFAEAADPQFLGMDQTVWIERAELERYNMRSALQWLHDTGRNEGAMRLAGALRWFWVIKRDVTEGSTWLDRTLERRQGVPPAIVATALSGAGLFALMRLDFERADPLLEEAVELFRRIGDPQGEARQLYHLANSAWLQDDLGEADRRMAVAHEVSAAAGDHWTEGWSLAVRGSLARLLGDLDAADGFMADSHDVFQRHGGRLDIGWSHLRLGALARDKGDYRTAEQHYNDGRDMLLGAGDPLGVAHADAGLGALAWLAGDHDHALSLFRGVLEGFNVSEEASSNLFELKTMIQGNAPTAELMVVVKWNRERAQMLEAQAGAKAAMGEYLYHMGKTAHRRGELARARHALTESMRLCVGATDLRGVAIAAAALAVISHQEGDEPTAARLFGLAESLVERDEGIPWPPPYEPGLAAVLEATATAIGADAFEEARSVGAALGLDEAVELIEPPTATTVRNKPSSGGLQ